MQPSNGPHRTNLGTPRYMPAIFGRRGYALLRRQESLPAVLVEVVRRLLLP